MSNLPKIKILFQVEEKIKRPTIKFYNHCLETTKHLASCVLCVNRGFTQWNFVMAKKIGLPCTYICATYKTHAFGFLQTHRCIHFTRPDACMVYSLTFSSVHYYDNRRTIVYLALDRIFTVSFY